MSLVLITAGTATAEEQANELPLFPMPSVLDFSRGSGWDVALGAAVEYEVGLSPVCHF